MTTDDIEKAKRLVKRYHTVVQIAPSIRTAIGEAFGLPAGTIVAGKVNAALKELGFRRVFPTDLGAEMRVMEEATELKTRLEKNKNLPMLTSCCPLWVNFCVKQYPELIPNLSTCKSPMEMVGSIAKTYYKEQRKLKNVKVVSIMPCTAKKMEVNEGHNDVVLTAMELVEWIKQGGIDFLHLGDMPYNTPMAMSSSAGAIYASTGGVSEATLRTYIYTNYGSKYLEHMYTEETELEGIRDVVFKVDGKKMRIGLVEGVKATMEMCKQLIEDKKKGKVRYEMVEVMSCPGGCVGGNGLPNRGDKDAVRSRIKILRTFDDCSSLKTAHDNPYVQEIYRNYIGKPYGAMAREILHIKDFTEVFSQ